MSNPNLPEGVTQKDIDRTVGETFDPNLCEHETIVCENCETSMAEVVRHMRDIGVAKHRLSQSVIPIDIKNVKMESILMASNFPQISETAAERDRLKAVNAELVEALKGILLVAVPVGNSTYEYGKTYLGCFSVFGNRLEDAVSAIAKAESVK